MLLPPTEPRIPQQSRWYTICALAGGLLCITCLIGSLLVNHHSLWHLILNLSGWDFLILMGLLTQKPPAMAHTALVVTLSSALCAITVWTLWHRIAALALLPALCLLAITAGVVLLGHHQDLAQSA